LSKIERNNPLFVLCSNLYRLYWPFTCDHCGTRGLVMERDWRCYKCGEDVIPHEYKSLEEQDLEWRRLNEQQLNKQ
jgi:DNA-directed RNA polymerase subunit RPC12/RpoP